MITNISRNSWANENVIILYLEFNLFRQVWFSYLMKWKCYQMASRAVERMFGHLRNRHQNAKTRMRSGAERKIDNARCCRCVHSTARFEHHGSLQSARLSQRGPRIEAYALTTRRTQVGCGRLESGESLIC